MTAPTIRWTIRDLEVMPDDGGGKRYEIIDGLLIVTRAPRFRHQDVASNIHFELMAWSRRTNLGKAVQAPGVVFSEIDAVIPDVVWASHGRIESGLDAAEHFVIAPELVVEVLSEGTRDQQRDREIKRKLYSLYGVEEYWIANWQMSILEVYRRQDDQLELVVRLSGEDRLISPLLPGFECAIASIFR